MFDTPVIINNFNRITTTKAMVEYLWRYGYNNIYILDNVSSFPPLLQWYDEVKEKVKIEYLPHNMMQNAIFDYQNGAFLQQFQGKRDWIAYTDSDLTLNPKMPYFFIGELIRLATKWGFKKAGLALQIDDLPDTPWGHKNKTWEEKFWTDTLEEDVYNAQLDTTFSIWNPVTPLTFSALRVGGDYTARHEPWYSDFSKLNEEEEYFLKEAHPYSTYKRFYDTNKPK